MPCSSVVCGSGKRAYCVIEWLGLKVGGVTYDLQVSVLLMDHLF